MQLGCRHLSLTRCASYDKSLGLSFDAEDYLRRFLNTCGASNRYTEVTREMERLTDLMPSDLRMWVKGRDFVPLLQNGASKNITYRASLRDVSALEGALALTVMLSI